MAPLSTSFSRSLAFACAAALATAGSGCLKKKEKLLQFDV